MDTTRTSDGQKAPNLLVIMSDEHQARAMGCAGHPFVQTPHMDALAARGMRFTDAYTPSPICVPARASFAAGRHVHKTRLWDNAMPYTGTPEGWGHALQKADVPVESIGKLHYRDASDPSGFDVQHIPMQVAGGHGMVWGSVRRSEERILMPRRMLGDEIGPGDSSYTQYDAAVTQQTCDWLESRAAQQDAAAPWCLYVGLVAPHFPLVVPQAFYDLYPTDQMPASKLRPEAGYTRHPWVEQQNAMADSEAMFRDAEERRSAIAAYYGLCSWLDHNLGQIMSALESSGLAETTTVIYTSDHGDNLGERGLWGKSTLYEESTSVPLIMAGPGVARGTCATPVSLLDVAASIPAHFGQRFDSDGTPLPQIAAAPPDPERPILSQYHAVGAVSGAYMLRKGRYKLHYYVGFAPELFDLQEDPEELRDLAQDPEWAGVLAGMEAHLCAELDPEAVDAMAFADQDAMIAGYGGREAALKLGAPAATPPPKV